MEKIELDSKKIVVKPLRYTQVSRAAKTWTEAFADDPLTRYQRADSTKLPKVIENAIQSFLLAHWKRKKRIALTVESGRAVLLGMPAQLEPPNRSEAFLDWLLQLVLGHTLYSSTAEQKKRLEEVTSKITKQSSETMGDRIKDMIYVSFLGTEPASQGKGYGGALVDFITALAKNENRAVWLHTLEHNIGFYGLHGFKVVGQPAMVGDQNPTWKEPPVVIRIMVYETPDSLKCLNGIAQISKESSQQNGLDEVLMLPYTIANLRTL